MEDLVEEREDLMVSPSTHLLKPCFTTSTEGSPPLDLKALSLSVSFNGWRFPNAKFKSWATKMSALHEPTWKKAGIFEAVVASTLKITKDSDLVLEIAEKWCPDTNTFVFPWGEATITLEDVLLLLGFSVLGSPVFASLDSSGEKTKEKLEKERVVLKRDQVSNRATQTVWMSRFMDSGDDDELEHVAFLALWLSYFVFPTRYYQINEAVFPVAVHLASGFGLLQDVHCPVNRSNLSEEEAWDEYNKPIEDLTLFIPSRSAVPRVTSMFCDWWRKSYPQLQGSLRKNVNIIGDDTSASGSRKRTRRKRVCTVGCCQTHDSDDDEDLSLTIAQIRRLSIKKCSGGEDASEPLGKKSRFEADNNDSGPLQELVSVRANGKETVPPPEIEQKNEGNDDELNVHGSNLEKMAMPNDGNKEPECLLHEDEADNNETTPCQNLAPGGSQETGESNKGKAVGDGTQGDDCLFHDTVLGSEEHMKSTKSLHNVKKLASSIEKLALSIDERIARAERNVAWLKERKATKQKKIAAAAARLLKGKFNNVFLCFSIF
ncbi:BnaC06g04160D [Brassica napus]|uniref:BnaC06g04160D protein n=1 Tax=Brassica napus TaxID=3708 RepID=A0A078GII8_BRANA|nr:BnaC06g04160D [Brassica napus]